MDETEELRKKFRPLAQTTVPQAARARVQEMIDTHNPNSTSGKRITFAEIWRGTGAVLAAMIVASFVILHVKNPLPSYTTAGTGKPGIEVGWQFSLFAPYFVLLGMSGILFLLAWIGRKTAFALAFRYHSLSWLIGSGTGLRLYDSARMQTYIAILFSWVMFAIFVAPRTTSPFVGVAAFLLFSALCGSLRYLLFAVVALLLATVPAWWMTVLPSSGIESWYRLIFFNIVFFIMTPGLVLISSRNAMIRRLQKRKGGR
ncbi:hypothetical protein [Alicyclobacillus sp. SO9]|uniref:hypothetical protein n=1 Tax=Alicyclobacillus sp. SO9 TaxID=2665646 RepID=UPI0018E87282|nr:hypothetical protein [Alicyclobacillus sp. SO9]QQE80009.1 hypothetical protein GI364_05925 [Alicyclobacillus sp. SO9]